MHAEHVTFALLHTKSFLSSSDELSESAVGNISMVSNCCFRSRIPSTMSEQSFHGYSLSRSSDLLVGCPCCCGVCEHCSFDMGRRSISLFDLNSVDFRTGLLCPSLRPAAHCGIIVMNCSVLFWRSVQGSISSSHVPAGCSRR